MSGKKNGAENSAPEVDTLNVLEEEFNKANFKHLTLARGKKRKDRYMHIMFDDGSNAFKIHRRSKRIRIYAKLFIWELCNLDMLVAEMEPYRKDYTGYMDYGYIPKFVEVITSIRYA